MRPDHGALPETEKTELEQLRLRVKDLEAHCAGLARRMQLSETQQRAFAASAIELRYTISAQGILLSMTPNVHSSLGFAPEEIVGKPFRALVHPDDIQIVQAYVNNAIKTNQSQQGIESRVRHKDGTWRWHLSNGSAVRDAAGRLLCYAAAALDVSEFRASQQALAESENRLNMASTAAGAYIWEMDLQSGALSPSGLYLELGYRDAEVPTRREQAFALIHPHDISTVKHAMNAHIRGHADAYVAEFRLRAKNGAWQWFKSTGRIVARDKDGGPRRLLGLTSNITQRKKTEENLRRSERNLQTILKASPVGVCVLRADGGILFCNARFAEMANQAPDLLYGTRIQSFYADPARHDELLAIYKIKGSVSNEGAQLKLPGMKTYWALLTWTPMVYEGHQAILFWTYDITELKNAEAQLRELATTDGLTGLYNRRYFLELSTRELALSQRANRPTSLLMLDADRFKSINDTYGHDVGDIVLKTIAKVCRAKLRDVDIFGRMGGEEFAVFLPETNKEGAIYAAERLRRALAETPVVFAGGILSFTMSIGVATATDQTLDVESLLKQADIVLYAAKQKGRNRVESS